MKSKLPLIILIIVVIVLAAGIYLFFRNNSTKPSTKTTSFATLAFLPASGIFKVGDTFDAKIVLNTGGAAVNGAQVYFDYDPTKLEIVDQDATKAGTQITTGKIFNLYMDNKEVSKTGSTAEFVITGNAVNAPDYNGTNGVVGTVKFKALAVAPTAEVTFNFAPDNYDKTGVTQNSINVLKSVTNAVFNIK